MTKKKTTGSPEPSPSPVEQEAVQLEFTVSVDPTAEHPSQDYVCFRTGPCVDGFPTYHNLWESFYWDLLTGRPFPLQFTTHKIDGEQTLIAMALFLYRDTLISERTFPLVMAAKEWSEHPTWGLSLVSRDVALFLEFLRAFFQDADQLNDRMKAERLSTALEWIHDYLVEGTLPAVPYVPQPEVLDIGTGGFVLAETKAALERGRTDLFREGYLRGILIREEGPMRHVLVFRKSLWIEFPLKRSVPLLNEAERKMGGEGSWDLVDALTLVSPKRGTLLNGKQIFAIVSHL